MAKDFEDVTRGRMLEIVAGWEEAERASPGLAAIPFACMLVRTEAQRSWWEEELGGLCGRVDVYSAEEEGCGVASILGVAALLEDDDAEGSYEAAYRVGD